MPVAFDIPRISSLYSCGIFSNKAGFKNEDLESSLFIVKKLLVIKRNNSGNIGKRI